MKIITTLVLAICVMVAASAAETGHDHDAHGALNPKNIELFTPYPLNHCIVSDEAFGGEMGDALSFVHDGQEYTICCKSCTKKFAKDPAKYAKKLAAKKLEAHKKGAAAHGKEEKKDAHADHDHGAHDHGGHKH